jgi:molybdopterin-binding protein
MDIIMALSARNCLKGKVKEINKGMEEIWNLVEINTLIMIED